MAYSHKEDKAMTLIKRLEAGSRPDRELDCAVYLTVNGLDPGDYKIRADILHLAMPAYTSSLDACISLAERVLPGCDWGICRDKLIGECQAYIGRNTEDASDVVHHHAEPCRAFLIALLRAKEAEHGK